MINLYDLKNNFNKYILKVNVLCYKKFEILHIYMLSFVVLPTIFMNNCYHYS